jgi:hypothetical protein
MAWRGVTTKRYLNETPIVAVTATKYIYITLKPRVFRWIEKANGPASGHSLSINAFRPARREISGQTAEIT